MDAEKINAILAAQYQSGTVRALPLDPPQTIPIGIATPHKELLSPAALRFLEMARGYFTV